MNMIKKITDRYIGCRNDDTTRNKIKFEIARRMNTNLENVKVEYNDQDQITNVTVKQRSRHEKVHVMGRHEPVDFIRGRNFSKIIFDDEWGSREVSAEGGVLTEEIFNDAYEQSLKSFGTVQYPTLYQADFNNQPEDRTQNKLNNLRQKIKELEEELYQKDQDVEYYKMLALEN